MPHENLVPCHRLSITPTDSSSATTALLSQNDNVEPSKTAELVSLNDSDTVPFTIITWNIWFSRHAWQERLEAAISQTLLRKPEIFCFQEVTTEVHSCMLRCQYLCERYEPTEQRPPHGYDVAIWVKKNEDGQQRPFKWHCTSIPLESIYGRRGLWVDVEIPHKNSERLTRVRVATVHLESGREMVNVRKRQLTQLFSYIRNVPWTEAIQKQLCIENNSTPDVSFLVGDFNLDPSYPENAFVEANGIDVWSVLRPNDAGFTEDTNINEMRLYSHCKHKLARYDRVLIVPQTSDQTWAKARPCSIELLGDKPFDEEGKLWPSDHFGLVARVGLLFQEVDVESYRSQPGAGDGVNEGYNTP